MASKAKVDVRIDARLRDALASYMVLASDLARRLTIKGDAAYVLEAYKQAGIPVPPLVAREGTGEDS